MERPGFNWRCLVILFMLEYIPVEKLVTGSTIDESSWTVQTSSGPIAGTITKGFSGREVHVFFGIPYAEPPLNELRFRPPEPIKPWTEILHATKKPLPCYQQYTLGKRAAASKDGTLLRRPWSEDCLKLNIWTPKPKPINEPVIVLVHSGGFLTGSSTFPFMDGSTLAAHSHDVIVSMNYRLGAFGFLNHGVLEAPGNVGLLDQQLALKWIGKNIQYFGGNSNGVILVGSGGAGSASVGLHLMSSGSTDYFRTSAFVGGAPTCPWTFQTREKSLNISRTLSKRLSCDRDSVEEELNCLRNVHPEDILDAIQVNVVTGSDYFRPTVDGNFITESPDVAFKLGHFARKPVLVWTDSHEGSLTLLRMNPDVMATPEKGFNISGFRRAVSRILPDVSEAGILLLEELYIGKCNLEDPLLIRDAAIRLYSDAITDCCVNNFVESVARHGVETTRTVDELLRDSNPSWVGGAHMLTIQYVLGYPLAPELNGYSKAEANLSAEFIMWINDHTRRRAKEVEENLSLFNIEKKPYVYWDAIGPNYYFKYREEHCKIWNQVIPELMAKKQICDG